MDTVHIPGWRSYNSTCCNGTVHQDRLASFILNNMTAAHVGKTFVKKSDHWPNSLATQQVKNGASMLAVRVKMPLSHNFLQGQSQRLILYFLFFHRGYKIFLPKEFIESTRSNSSKKQHCELTDSTVRYSLSVIDLISFGSEDMSPCSPLGGKPRTRPSIHWSMTPQLTAYLIICCK